MSSRRKSSRQDVWTSASERFRCPQPGNRSAAAQWDHLDLSPSATSSGGRCWLRDKTTIAVCCEQTLVWVSSQAQIEYTAKLSEEEARFEPCVPNRIRRAQLAESLAPLDLAGTRCARDKA